jgi:hypothetical protein
MPQITIENKAHDLGTLTDDAKAQLQIQQLVDTELQAVKAESIGWLPLGQGVYLHQGEAQASHEAIVIQVVGIPDANMAGMYVVLLA